MTVTAATREAPSVVPDEYASLLRRLAEAPPLDTGASDLVDRALTVWVRPGFDTFVSLPRLRFDPYPHQLQAAERVLRRMHGRAILADEVGLGKTIEAGLITSELRLRGLARSVLVVTPPGLVDQWREELDRKFALPSVVADSSGWPEQDRGDEPIVIASLATARRGRLRERVRSRAWDLVVCDEAHRLRNPQSASGRLARSLRARHLLLLTATPVENRIDDLFHLVSLVRPGHLGTAREFKTRHAASGAAGPRNLADLQARTREVMVRHRRSEVAVALPGRLASTRRVRPSPEEAALYEAVSERVRDLGTQATPAVAMSLRAIQRPAGSSPAALAAALERQEWHDLAARANSLPETSKTHALAELMSRHASAGEKVVVFTAFRRTLDVLADAAARAGLDAVQYHGAMTRRAKDHAIGAFRDHGQVLLTTEAAGEGRNLQFCHVMVNYDLPWNPMAIEQRLGRIHRIGQPHDVLLTNLVTRGTLEDRILQVLERKINLFELVVGELDMILGRVDDDFDFETAVFDAHVRSRDDTELDARLEQLGEDLARARSEYLSSRERTDVLVGAEDGA